MLRTAVGIRDLSGTPTNCKMNKQAEVQKWQNYICLHLDFSLFLVQVSGLAGMTSQTQHSYFHRRLKEMYTNEDTWGCLGFPGFNLPPRVGTPPGQRNPESTFFLEKLEF